jgi:hypothetical protein
MSVRHNISGTPRWRMLHRLLAHPNSVKDAVKPFVPTSLRRQVRRWRAIVMERNIVPTDPGMAAATRQELMDLFRADILELQDLIGRDLSSWLDMTPSARPARTGQIARTEITSDSPADAS